MALFLLIGMVTLIADWTTPTVINQTFTKTDTSSTITVKSTILPSKKNVVADDSVTYFLTGPSNTSIVLKQIRFVLNKKTLDTVSLVTKASGTTYASVTVANSESPKSVFFEQYDAVRTIDRTAPSRPYTGQVTANIIYNKK